MERLEAMIRRAVGEAVQGGSLPPLWQASLRQVAEAAAEKAVAQSLARLGLDLEDAAGWREDMHYIRQRRVAADYIRRRVLAGLCSLLLASGLWMVWEGIGAVLPLRGGQAAGNTGP